MSEAKDADVDRLTKEEMIERTISSIELFFNSRKANKREGPYRKATKEERRPMLESALSHFATQLQSLSHEAVRDEVLEEAAEAVNHLALYGPPEYSLAFCQAVEAIRVLKREPNAAAWDRSTERASGERTSAGTSPSPAPAAPDVAEMVKRLEELQSAWLPGIGECFPITFTPAERTTLLARLGQGWIPSETVIEIDEDGKVHPEGANLKNLRPGASDD